MASGPVSTVADVVAAYQKAMASASTADNYRKGINAYQGNPMAAAATPAATAAYIAGVQRAVDSGKRAAGLAAADPAVWKANAVGTGASRLASGAVKAAAKQTRALAKYQPVWAQIRSTLATMPKGGSANAKARSNAVIDAMMTAAGTA